MALVLPFLNLRAEETENAKSTMLEELGGLISNLKNLKNNDRLSLNRKDQQEIILRSEALSKILNLASLETDDLRLKIGALLLESQEQKDLADNLSAAIEAFQAYYDGLKQQLAAAGTLEEIKDLTKDFQNWRKANYSKNISLISNFILVFNEKEILGVADARLEKIVSDLNQLDGAGLIDKGDFQFLLKSASLNLGNARLFNKKAESLLFLSASNTVVVENADARIKQLTQSALKEIKSAYKNFLEISKRVRDLLQK